MAKAAATKRAGAGKKEDKLTLAEALTLPAPQSKFSLWLIGDAPLICHAWSEKARMEMLSKQVKTASSAKEARDPQAEFIASLYPLPDGGYGFPVLAVKASIIGSADKSKGLAKSGATGAAASIWLDVPYRVQQRTAVPGAISDMALLRIYGSDPQMREDRVVLNRKTTSLAYRAQFDHWALRVTGSFNPAIVSPVNLVRLIQEGGRGVGIGDWRPARSGDRGTYRLARPDEIEPWDAFARGEGPLPEKQELSADVLIAAE